MGRNRGEEAQGRALESGVTWMAQEITGREKQTVTEDVGCIKSQDPL